MDETTEKLAREAGLVEIEGRLRFTPKDGSPTFIEGNFFTDHRAASLGDLARFAALVRADERERCAKVCDTIAKKYKAEDEWPEDRTAPETVASECAAAIRNGERSNG